ncbi:MAG TPA: dipeptidase [Terracidiphilus sp.]|nr:dipeptidase [Terracidiphilus sp.]
MTQSAPSPAAVHRSAIVIDTHADTPQRFLDEGFDLAMPRVGGDLNLDSIREGNLAAQFFAIFVEPERYQGQYAHRALEMIDALRQQVARHSDQIDFATSADGILAAHRAGKFAALMGIEGGHAIEGSLRLLRIYHALGARYMTLTWNNSNGWADSSGDMDDPNVAHTEDGLTEFGEQVVREMNRLGMMVDISHVSDRTFYRVLGVSCAPVIASHSSARALCNAPRNLTDDMIRAVAASGGPQSQGGVVMVNFYSGFLSQPYLDALKATEPECDREVEALKSEAVTAGKPIPWDAVHKLKLAYANRIPRPPFTALIDHIDHVAKIGGVDHTGIGSDFDGVGSQLPEGMDSPADLPKITAALMTRGYSAEDCHNILGGNLLRVFHETEQVSREGA